MCELTLEEQRELSKTLREVYGEDYIIVYQPEDLDYFITTSHNKPSRTMEILESVVKR